MERLDPEFWFIDLVYLSRVWVSWGKHTSVVVEIRYYMSMLQERKQIEAKRKIEINPREQSNDIVCISLYLCPK